MTTFFLSQKNSFPLLSASSVFSASCFAFSTTRFKTPAVFLHLLFHDGRSQETELELPGLCGRALLLIHPVCDSLKLLNPKPPSPSCPTHPRPWQSQVCSLCLAKRILRYVSSGSSFPPSSPRGRKESDTTEASRALSSAWRTWGLSGKKRFPVCMQRVMCLPLYK